MRKLVWLPVAFALSGLPAWAAPRTVTLEVPGMTCAACPITVKKALTKVAGVSKADVDYDNREAIITFDDTKTSAEALIRATTNAGYPSTVKGVAQ